MAFGHADFGSNKLVESITGLSGHHRLDGILILAGAGVKPGTHLEDANILDLTPTIMHAMGLALPRELDGRVLNEAFDAASAVARPVTYRDVNIYKEGVQTPGFSEDEMAEVQEKLQGWGYAG
jgi:hypothetical protein